MPMFQSVTSEQMKEAMDAVGADHAIIATDSGQPFSPKTPDMFRMFAQVLHEKGVAIDDLSKMAIQNPARLLGVTPKNAEVKFMDEVQGVAQDPLTATRGLNPMTIARHPMPPEVAELSLEEIAARYVRRYRDCAPDWEAFEDAKVDGYRRAQHRFIGGGGVGQARRPPLHTATRLYAEHHVRRARRGQRGPHPRGRGGLFRPPGHAHGIHRGGKARAGASTSGSAPPGSASHARPGSSTATSTTAWSRSTSR